MQLTELPVQAIDRRLDFFTRSANAWQNYFNFQGLLAGIELTPEQLALVLQYEGHMLINGSAGSGKSITLLYKLLKVMGQENERKRILYLTYNKTLLDDAKKRAKGSLLFDDLNDKHELQFCTFHFMAYQLLQQIGFKDVKQYKSSLNKIKEHESDLLRRVLVLQEDFTGSQEYKLLTDKERLFATQNAAFLLEEFLWMKANGYVNKEDYFEVERTGRSHNPRLTKAQRTTVYRLFEEYGRRMKERYHQDFDMEDYALLLLKYFNQIPQELHYDYVFVDEVQDLQPMQIKSLVLLTRKSIVISGDQKQRIYKRSPHTYANLGLNLQGRRSKTLTKNFRSTKQIMKLANAIKFDDVENDREDEQNFVNQGDKPEIRFYDKAEAMHLYLVKEIKDIMANDPGCSVAVIHRYEEELHLKTPLVAKRVLEMSFYLITAEQYSSRFDYESAKKPVFFTDAYSVKGLEFDYVFILQFDRYHYPNSKRIEELNKRAEKKNTESYIRDFDVIFNDEKKVLYVAITRAKKKVVLLWTAEDYLKVSQFIRDFNVDDYDAYGFDKSKFKSQLVLI